MFRLPKNTEITKDLLQEFINEHTEEVDKRYKPLMAAYMSDHDILHAPAKAKHKPDNRIVVNFPKYIVDTTNGFFIGNPIKTVADEEAVAAYVEHLDQYNDQDDNNAELSKICSIYGKGFEMYYTDEEAELCITYLSPEEAFIIYDDSIIERPMYFVRRYTDRDKNEWGSISNIFGVRYFKITGGVDWLKWEEGTKDLKDEWKQHYFTDVPATEYLENSERQGIFEPIMSMVNAYNKALSEKANDVDYFADAYLKVIGVDIDDEDIQFIRDNRIINLFGDPELTQNFIAEFMDKPNNDDSQENLLNRLERLIFQIGQTANASDENFGTSSGIAMLYKMWNTSNRGKTKQRKFESGMKRRYKLLFNHPASPVPADSWLQLHYQFTPNIPQNLKEEVETAAAMEGITSKETQLKVISAVDDVQGELEKIEEENKAPEETIVDKAMFGKLPAQANNAAETESGGAAEVQGKTLNGAQTQSLIAIMAQFSAGSLSEGQAINLIATAIGISKAEARAILNGELNE